MELQRKTFHNLLFDQSESCSVEKLFANLYLLYTTTKSYNF